MNIILFEEHELGRSLSRRDERTIHLLKVLHKKAGDVFEAGILASEKDKSGLRGMGRIEKINFDGSIFVSVSELEPPPPRLQIRMAVGFVRPIQIRRILRELSNIGAAAVDFMGTDLGEKSYRDTKLFEGGVGSSGARLALIEGAAQSRDTSLPVITIYSHLDKWLREKPWEKDFQNQIPPKPPLLAALDNVRPEGSFFNIGKSCRSAVLAIGPERGWSDRERDLFEQSGFLRLSMGTRALRTETACVAAAVLAMQKLEE